MSEGPPLTGKQGRVAGLRILTLHQLGKGFCDVDTAAAAPLRYEEAVALLVPPLLPAQVGGLCAEPLEPRRSLGPRVVRALCAPTAGGWAHSFDNNKCIVI